MLHDSGKRRWICAALAVTGLIGLAEVTAAVIHPVQKLDSPRGSVAFLHGERYEMVAWLFRNAHPGDRLFGEGESEGHRAHKFAVDVNGTAAHTLQDAGFGERTAGEPRQDDGLVRPHIFEHAEDFHLEFGDAIARKDGASDAVHTGPDVF